MRPNRPLHAGGSVRELSATTLTGDDESVVVGEHLAYLTFCDSLVESCIQLGIVRLFPAEGHDILTHAAEGVARLGAFEEQAESRVLLPASRRLRRPRRLIKAGYLTADGGSHRASVLHGCCTGCTDPREHR